MVENLPDGIHSGLVKPNAKGSSSTSSASGTKRALLTLLRCLKRHAIVENSLPDARTYPILQCGPGPRRVSSNAVRSAVCSRFQEQVIADILKSVAEQKALEVAPRTIDPVQQTVATAIQGYLNHPQLDRKEAIDLIRFLNQPMLSVQMPPIARGAQKLQGSGAGGRSYRGSPQAATDRLEPQAEGYGGRQARGLERKDLRLICFEFLSGG